MVRVDVPLGEGAAAVLDAVVLSGGGGEFYLLQIVRRAPGGEPEAELPGRFAAAAGLDHDVLGAEVGGEALGGVVGAVEPAGAVGLDDLVPLGLDLSLNGRPLLGADARRRSGCEGGSCYRQRRDHDDCGSQLSSTERVSFAAPERGHSQPPKTVREAVSH